MGINNVTSEGRFAQYCLPHRSIFYHSGHATPGVLHGLSPPALDPDQPFHEVVSTALYSLRGCAARI